MKYFKFIIIFIFGLCLFSSCGGEDDGGDTGGEIIEPPKPENEDVTYEVTFDYQMDDIINVIDVVEGDVVPNISTAIGREDVVFIGWSKTGSELDLFDLNTPVYEDFTLYGIWEYLYKDYSYFLDEYVPDFIESSIELPQIVDDLRLMWSTSDSKILDYTGSLVLPRKEQNLTVYLSVYDNGYITDYEKEVRVAALNLPKLPVGNLVIGYYSTWYFAGYSEEQLKTCDIINLCFGYVNANYTVDFSSCTSVINKVMKAHESGVRVLLSIQGYASGGTNFSNAAKTKAGREKLAKSMIRVMQEYNLDGIDIDWEYPGYGTGTDTAIDRANYTLLMQEIKEQMNAVDETYLLTAAIPGGPYTTSRFDLPGVSKWLDFINIMTYDLNNSNSSHHTALYDSAGTSSGCSVDASVKYYLQNGVPKEKIIIGCAFYGKYCHATKLGTSGGGYKTIAYTKMITDYISRIGNGVKYYYDDVACAPYLIDEVNGIFITYDDENSLKAKCEYALNKGLGGVMIWELGEDQTSTLIKTIYNVMKKPR